MRELIIICEGYTEEEFVKNSVRSYFLQHNIYKITPIRVTSSPGHKGGLPQGSYQKFKNDTNRYLRQMNDVIVTTLIDFYHLPHDFPEYEIAMQKQNVEGKINHLVDALKRDVNNERFIPYIQLHEFEALLFSKMDGFNELPDITASQLAKIQKIIDIYDSPEKINDGLNTAPSKRLISIIPNYNKILFGNQIPLENGFDSILSTCPRFNNWITTLIDRMKA